MSYGLGQTRALQKMYVVGIPGTRIERAVAGRNAATSLAEKWARGYRRRSHIHAYGSGGRKGRLLAIIGSNGAMELYGALGMGDILTDWACDQAAHSATWRERMNQGLDAGAQAALIGGLAAGLLGALIKSPIFGAVTGGVVTWAAYAIWTGPLAPE